MDSGGKAVEFLLTVVDFSSAWCTLCFCCSVFFEQRHASGRRGAQCPVLSARMGESRVGWWIGPFGVVRELRAGRGRSGRVEERPGGKWGRGKKERRIRPGELSEPSRWIASVLSCRPEMRRSAKEICAQSPARNREKWTRVERGWGLEAYQLVEGVVVFICCVVTAPNGVAEGLFLGQGRMVMIYRKGRIHREVVHYRLSVELNSVKTGSDIDFHT